MIQLKDTDTLQVLLAGAITTSQGVLYAAFADIATDGSTFAPSPSSGATNSTTAVDWVAAPAADIRRVVKYLSLYNADTVSITATVRVVDNGTNRILGKFTLASGEQLQYVDGAGFQTSAGAAGVTSVNGYAGPAVTLTNADLGVSVQSVVSAATVTPTFADDEVCVTAQAAALDLVNPTGSAVNGWGVVIRIKDNGTARAITYGTQYRAIGVTLPTTTVIGKTLYLGMVFNSADTKWDVLAVCQEA